MRETNNFFAQTLDFLPIRHFEKYLGPVFLGFSTQTPTRNVTCHIQSNGLLHNDVLHGILGQLGSITQDLICDFVSFCLFNLYVSFLFVCLFVCFIVFFMPNVCCCVPDCFANNRKYSGLIFHRLPKKEKIFASWPRLIRDENLDPTTRDNKRICGMHFHGGNRSHPQLLQINTYPTFFPWKKSWDTIVQNYRSCKPSASETEISAAKEVNATLGKHVYGEDELMATLVAAKPELSFAYIKASHNKTVSASSACNHHHSVLLSCWPFSFVFILSELLLSIGFKCFFHFAWLSFFLGTLTTFPFTLSGSTTFWFTTYCPQEIQDTRQNTCDVVTSPSLFRHTLTSCIQYNSVV